MKFFNRRLSQFNNNYARNNKTYIFSTKFGFGFAFVAFILFAFALLSMNNLIYIFVFSFLGISLTSMGMTNKNVDQIQIQGAKAERCFAGESGSLYVELYNKSERFASKNLRLRLNGEKDFQAISVMGPRETRLVKLNWTPSQRGLVEVPRITLESDFPYGILRSWKIFREANKVLVFPKRKGDSIFKSNAGGLQSGADNFRDLREFRQGDSLRRVHWRASMKTQQLLVKNFEEEAAQDFDLNWDQTQGDLETRLSQLSLWIDEAEMQKMKYRLVTPWWTSSRGPHSSIWYKSLKSLALQKNPESA